MNLYRKGRIAERKVMRWLQYHGHTNIRRSAGSRGPADIYSISPSGTKTYTQVKSSSASLDSSGRKNLRHLAKERKGFAQYVHYENGRVDRVVPLGNWNRKRKRV
jgi:hypothetical protein